MQRTPLPGTPQPDRMIPGADGNLLALDEWGDSRHQPVILMHGGGQTRHAWKGTGEALAAEGYYAVAFDARGHGDSAWTAADRYETGHMSQDLIALTAHLSLSRPVLVGASMGGMVALDTLGHQQLDAAALVLVDIAPSFEDKGAARIRAFMRQGINGFDSLEEVADAIASYQPQRDRPRQLDGLAKNVRLGADARYYWHWDPAYLSRELKMSDTQRAMQQHAKQLRLPTLLIRGGLSDVLTEEGAQDFLRLCPHAAYENVTDAAHMVAGDRNDFFTSAVHRFLIKQTPAA